MSRIAAIAAACVAGCGVAALAQTPAPVTVVGQVVHAVTGEAIAGAEVWLNAAALNGAQRKAVTGEDGRFVFAGVPAGRYYLFASRAGFFQAGLNDESQHGASDELIIGWPGPPLLTMKLRPHGALAGTLSDAADNPVAGAKVTILVRTPVWPSWGLRLAWVPVENIKPVVTDKAGRYVVEAVDEGEYLIQVDATGVVLPSPSPTTFGVAYGPGVHVTSEAVSIRMGAGERRVADVRLSARPALDLSGVPDVPAVDARSVYVQLFAIEDGDEPIKRLVAEQSVEAGGSFKFSRLPPGDYLLEANVNDRFWGDRRIRMDDRSINDLHLVLAPFPVVSGRIIWEGADRPPERSTLVQPVTMIFSGSELSADAQARIAAARPIGLAEMLPVGPSWPNAMARSFGAIWTSDTTFTLTLPPGRFLANHSHVNGWIVKSFRISGQDAVDEPVDIASSSRDAVLTLTRAVGEVRGTVVTPAGAPDPWCQVILFSTNPRVWPGLHARQELQVYSPLADETGRFAVKEVLPGEYYLAATSWVETLDEALLTRLAATAERVRVPPGVPVDRLVTRRR